MVINPQFDFADDFQEGLAKIELAGKYGFTDKIGEMAINPQFDGAWDFQEGLARIKLAGKYGFIDKTGKIVINPQFDGADNFEEGLMNKFVMLNLSAKKRQTLQSTLTRWMLTGEITEQVRHMRKIKP